MTRRCVATSGYMRGSSERREKRLLVGSHGGLPHCQIAGSPLSFRYRSRPKGMVRTRVMTSGMVTTLEIG
jgi:hypothetical protein